MGTREKLEDLQLRRQVVEAGGGEARVEKQHASGKMTARERIDLLLDAGSFTEVDAFVTHRCSEFDMPKTKAPGEGVVCGYGKVDGRLVFVYSQDFTVIGGSLGEMHAKKICKVMDMAMRVGAPLIGINDSGGARIQEGLDALSGFGEIFYRNTRASGVIPQISVIMGPCAGGAVYSPAITDFVFMVEKTSQMFITGPQVVSAVTGEKVSAEELGGANAQASRSGVAHFTADSDAACLEKVKRLLAFLPSNNRQPVTFVPGSDAPERMCEALNEIIPDGANKSYDVKEIIKEVVDDHDFLEISEQFARNIVIGLARMDGATVGIVANQPRFMAGSLDVDSADKAARFVRFCDCFNIPILTFTDVPGYLPGVSQEHNGIIRHGAKLLFAYSEASVPLINIILRKAYGGAYIAMSSKHLGADMVFAWPGAQIGMMDARLAAKIMYADSDAATINEKAAEYADLQSSAMAAAKRGYVDSIIEAEDTRKYVIGAFEMLFTKREDRPSKKHGTV